MHQRVSGALLPRQTFLQGILLGAAAAYAYAFYRQTQDPMVLVMGLVAIAAMTAVNGLINRGRGLPFLHPWTLQEPSARCPGCNQPAPPGARFCDACGHRL